MPARVQVPPVRFCQNFVVSPLMLADRILTLAQQAEQAGLADTAGHLVNLAYAVFDEPPARLVS